MVIVYGNDALSGIDGFADSISQLIRQPTMRNQWPAAKIEGLNVSAQLRVLFLWEHVACRIVEAGVRSKEGVDSAGGIVGARVIAEKRVEVSGGVEEARASAKERVIRSGRIGLACAAAEERVAAA